MTGLDLAHLGRLVDVSAVYPAVPWSLTAQLIQVARRYSCVCASATPWATPAVIEQLADRPDIAVTGNVAFPAGADTTAVKVAAVRQFVAMGCRELDVVINLSAFKSGRPGEVLADLKAVVEAADGVPVKAIIEVPYLTADEITAASALVVEAGGAFVKTGTGWAAGPSTVEHVRLIRRAVGAAAQIKVSGGVRTVAAIQEFYQAGATRFGIGVRSAPAVLEEAARLAAAVPEGE
ncbi:MAG: deoxyribose-phosphate aldolase [Bifidobacteriaceae bacterium]|nr:deoxyribose-phosphate aldolase [Bifidobacteriaceae bacterium]